MPASRALAAPLGSRSLQTFVGLQLHDRAGQLLGQSVVDFAGDQLPLAVARFQQVLQGLPSRSARLLGLASLGDVTEQPQHAQPPAVPQGVAHHVGREGAAVFTQHDHVPVFPQRAAGPFSDSFERRRQLLGRVNVGNRHREQFFFDVAEHSAKGRIDAQDPLRFGIHDRQPFRHPFVDLPKGLVAGRQFGGPLFDPLFEPVCACRIAFSACRWSWISVALPNQPVILPSLSRGGECAGQSQR